MKHILTVAMIAAMAAACGPKVALLPSENFDSTIDGKQTALYTIKGGDCIAQVTNFGGRVVSLFVPDAKGGLTDVVLGHTDVDGYKAGKGERFVGCCVGPVANRIAGGHFTIDGVEYTLPKNNNGQTLHGGLKGVDQVVWDVVEVKDDAITMKYTHPDGMEGFPGNTEITLTYTLTDCNALAIEYSAVSDKKTPINLSHHAMFCLGGECSENIENQLMMMNADYFTPIDEVMIPLGELAFVEGTPFDFRKPKTIGQDINVENEQLKIGRGYDHNFVINENKPCCKEEKEGCCKKEGEGKCCGNCDLKFACFVWSPMSGVKMDVLTDQPGIQFYSGNFFDGSATGKNGKPTDFRTAIALETQNFPDAVNQPTFPNSVYEPGQVYTHKCVYKFSVWDGKCCCKGECEK